MLVARLTLSPYLPTHLKFINLTCNTWDNVIPTSDKWQIIQKVFSSDIAKSRKLVTYAFFVNVAMHGDKESPTFYA